MNLWLDLGITNRVPQTVLHIKREGMLPNPTQNSTTLIPKPDKKKHNERIKKSINQSS